MINKKILVIGAGSIGKRHAKCFENLNCEIDIADISKKRIMEAKGKIKVVDSFIDYRRGSCLYSSTPSFRNVKTSN